MRVTTTSAYQATARNLGAALARTHEVSAQISSGRRIQAWSDDAPAATAADAYRTQEADYSSFQRVAEDAKGWLGSADGVLQSMSGLLARVRELSVAGQSGSLSASSREAIAQEVDQLRLQLRDFGNTQHLGRPLFGGFAETALETAEDGTVSFAGDGSRVQRQISPTVVLPVTVDGAALFGFDSPQGDVFDVLAALSTAVREGDTEALSDAQTRLRGSEAAVASGLSFVGATTSRVEAAHEAGALALDRLTERRAELEEVDLAEAVLQLNVAQAGYQAALGAAAKANLPTLADFLK